MNRPNAGLALLCGPFAFGAALPAAEAQQAGKVYRVAWPLGKVRKRPLV